MSPSVWGILLLGGQSQRFQQGLPPEASVRDKLQWRLAGSPVWQWSLSALLGCPSLSGLVVVAPETLQPLIQDWVQQRAESRLVYWASPGQDRRGSVYSALLTLEVLAPECPCDAVLIHDGARPLATADWIEPMIQHWHNHRETYKGLIAGHPLHDTLKRVQPGTQEIEKTLSRQSLWQVQTPQLFSWDALVKAHRLAAPRAEATDDAQLLEMTGQGPVALYLAPANNLKLTTQADLPLLEALAQCQTLQT